MPWRVVVARLDHTAAIPSIDTVVLIRILDTPTNIINTIQQDREALDLLIDLRSMIAEGYRAKHEKELAGNGMGRDT